MFFVTSMLVTWQYSLSLECSLKSHWLRLDPQLGTVRRWWTLPGGPSGSDSDHKGYDLEGVSRNPILLINPSGYEANRFLPPCTLTGPKATGLTDYGLKPSELSAKIKLSFLNFHYLNYFITVMEIWLTHLIYKRVGAPLGKRIWQITAVCAGLCAAQQNLRWDVGKTVYEPYCEFGD
jgi:hypothetical protein